MDFSRLPLDEFSADEKQQERYGGLEYSNCCICGSTKSSSLFSAPVQDHQKGIFDLDSFPIVKCSQCGLLYVNPRISSEANNKYYEFSLPKDHDFLDKHFFETYSIHKKRLDRYIRVIKKYKDGGHLLDIGCGNGYFLTRAKDSGYSVEGQEISPLFINYCRQELNLVVHSGELEKLKLEVASFDVITMFDVIEHVYHPDKLLNECKRLLKPGGILVITTHDAGNFLAKRYGHKWHMIYPIGHIYYFTSQTLRSLIKSADFKEMKSGLAYIVDETWYKTFFNYLASIFKSIFLRTLIIYLYKPVAKVFPFLTKWKMKIGSFFIDHQKLLFLAGDQVNFNDEIFSISTPS